VQDAAVPARPDPLAVELEQVLRGQPRQPPALVVDVDDPLHDPSRERSPAARAPAPH
jgi:hypothetical protein